MTESTAPVARQISGTQSIGRAIDILRVIASNGRRGYRLDDIANKALLSKTTCARILNRLCTERVIRKEPVSGRYCLGPLVHELALLARPDYSLVEQLTPMLKRLADVTQDTVYLSELRGLDAVCTACQTGEYPIKVLPLDAGLRRPLGVAAGGLAILATLPGTEADRILNSIGSGYRNYEPGGEPRVRERLQATRARGYAIEPGYGAPGTTSISIGLPLAEPAASITVTAINSRMADGRKKDIVALMQDEIARAF